MTSNSFAGLACDRSHPPGITLRFRTFMWLTRHDFLSKKYFRTNYTGTLCLARVTVWCFHREGTFHPAPVSLFTQLPDGRLCHIARYLNRSFAHTARRINFNKLRYCCYKKKDSGSAKAINTTHREGCVISPCGQSHVFCSISFSCACVVCLLSFFSWAADQSK